MERMETNDIYMYMCIFVLNIATCGLIAYYAQKKRNIMMNPALNDSR